MDKFASEISGMLDSLNEERMDVYSEFDGLLKLMNDSWGNTDVIRYFHKIEEVEESYAFTELGWGFIDGEVGIYKKEHISGDYYEYNLVVDVRPDKIRLAMLEFDDFVEGLKDHIAHELVSYHACKTIAKQALGEEVRERVFFRKDGVLFTNFGRTEINGQNVKEILKGGG